MIKIDLASSSSVVDTPDFLATGVSMEIILHQDHISLQHSLLFFCTTMDRGNNETTLKRILRALVIEDQFLQEIYPLLKIISPFDPIAAECFEYKNDTSDCPRQDFDRCQRCYGSLTQYLSSGANICQSCPRTQDISNRALHSSSFELKTQRRTEDDILLECQMNKCNSMDNLNRAAKASRITFDFDEFHKNSFNNVS